MDIVFVHPNGANKIYQDLSKDHSAIEPPIWAGMLANHCRTKGYFTTIVDAEVHRWSPSDTAVAAIETGARIICFVVYGQQPSASTQNMVGAIMTAEEIKKIKPDTTIVFVGGHVAALPAETLDTERSIDIVCQNEGVRALDDLLQVTNLFDTKQLNKVRGIGYRDSKGEVTLTTPAPVVPKKQLDQELPGVAWDLLPSLDRYRTAGWHSWSNNTEKQPFAALYTSLGCPYKCSFCMINIISRTNKSPHISASDSNLFRWWSPEFIIEQFDHFADQGIVNIKIADELFVLNPNHFMKICNLIIERRYKFNIWAYSRIDTCKPEYLKTLKKAGVNWLGLGIENPNQTLRREVHKDGFKEVKINNLIQNIRDEGINIGGNYIFGLPNDTEDSMNETLQFAMENKTEMINFYCAMAYPGSPLYLQAKKTGQKLPDSYEGYSQHAYETQNLATNKLTATQILKFRDRAWTKYNTNPSYLTMIEDKFGPAARKDMENTTKIYLKRKILGD